MSFRAISFPLLLFLFLPQSPGDSIRQHYNAAEAQHRAGNFAGAEAEYGLILVEAYQKLGKIYSVQSNYQETVSVLEAATRYQPDSPDTLVELAIAYFHTQQYQKAIVQLNKVVARDAGNVAAHHMLGKSYFMLDDFVKSANELQTALSLAPNDYDVAYTLGLAHLKQRHFDIAKQIYDRMSQQLGNRPQFRVLIGRAYRETGFLPQAIEEFKIAIALDPKFPRVHYYLGLTYLLKDGASRLDEAAEEFRIELASHPDEFFANYYLGILASIERKWDKAIGFLQKASQGQPNNPDPYFYLGQAYQGLGKHEQAIEVLRKSIALNPELRHNDYQVTNAHYRLGQSLLKLGKTDEAEKELQMASDLKAKAFKQDEARLGAFINAAGSEQKLVPELVSSGGVIAERKALDTQALGALKLDAALYAKVIAVAYKNIGLLRAERQDFRGAAEQFKLAAKWDPQSDGLNFNLGLASYKAELYKDALAPLETELKDHPESISVKQLLGLSYFMTEDYAKASALLTEVISAKPEEVALYYPLALSLIKQGKAAAANDTIQRMVAFGGNSPKIHILLAQAYYDQGDSAKALEELQTALSLDSKVSMAHFYSGLIYLKLGKFDEGTREFQAELTLNPNDLQAKYHLGYILLARQETEQGIKVMREVIQAKPDFADARYELGKALLQHGDIKGALDNLEIATKLGPDKPHVHYQLGRAYLAAGRKTEGENQLELSRQLKEKARNQPNQ
jgi:tetratricopeptide (TPR) repeat protein